MKSIPAGWIMNPDGSYSKPDQRKTPFLTVFQPHRNDPEPIKSNNPKRIRQDSKPLMNKLESRYYRILCDVFGEVNVKPQGIRLRLANGHWYKPDFAVFSDWTDDKIVKHVRCYELKGPHAFRGGFENLKVAASLYPQICFILVWEEGGVWKDQIVLP